MPFEEAVASVMEGLGYKVDKQVGSAGFRIDLAVRHPEQPGRYMLAVECDGATYHSALWARERDRLRQEVLENMGWRFHRIWSTDWFYRPGETIQRLKAALEEAEWPSRRCDRKNRRRPATYRRRGFEWGRSDAGRFRFADRPLPACRMRRTPWS